MRLIRTRPTSSPQVPSCAVRPEGSRAEAGRRWRAGLAAMALCAALLALAGTSHGASSVVKLQVMVAGAAELSLGSGQVVTLNVLPAQTVQQTLHIPVKANVPWVLQLKAAGRPALPDGGLISGTVGWSTGSNSGAVQSSADQVLASGAPTGEAGHTVPLTFEYTASFDDRPGTYSIDLTLVLAPQV